MRNHVKTNVLKLTAFMLGLVMCMMLPAIETQAATLAAPKDAAQTISVEDGFRVQWTPVAGATQYVYSFSSDDKTYTAENFTGNGGKENFVNIVNPSVLKPGTFYYVKIRAFNGSTYSTEVKVKVATAPKAPKGIKQTQADHSTVTFSWDASEGATGYLIRFGTSQATAKDIQKIIKTTSCKLTGLTADTAYYVAVYPIKQVTDKFYASQNYVDNAKVVTTGGPVTGLKLYDWDVKTNTVMLQWSNAIKYESGYEIEICKADGTKIKTYTVSGRRTILKAFTLKKIKNTPFQYRVRSYTTLAGNKCYGQWSEYAYAIPQANVKATKVSDTSVKLTWDKVNGAASYTIYRATKDGGKFTKVASTKKASYTVKKLKTYKDYYFMVKANKVNIGGKKRSSTKLSTQNDINVYIYKYQDTVSEE